MAKKTCTANIVAIGIIERQKIGHITFGQWVKPGAIVPILTLGIATLLIYLKFYA
jgi:Na+/H+ antiporter NhaD/arsenite permease-like protein